MATMFVTNQQRAQANDPLGIIVTSAQRRGGVGTGGSSAYSSLNPIP